MSAGTVVFGGVLLRWAINIYHDQHSFTIEARPSVRFAAIGVCLLLASVASSLAGFLVHDTFSDGDRTDGSDAADIAWLICCTNWTSQSAEVIYDSEMGSQALRFDAANEVLWIAGNIPAVTVGPTNSATSLLTFQFSFRLLEPGSHPHYLRVGLYSSEGTLALGDGDNAAWANDVGYYVSIGSGGNTNSAVWLEGARSFWGVMWTFDRSGETPLSRFSATVTGTSVHEFRLECERSLLGGLDFRVFLDGLLVGAGSDPSGSVNVFDQVFISPTSGARGGSIIIDDVFLFHRRDNSAPTDLLLSSSYVDVNQPPASFVGTFIALDPDDDESFSYSLVNGPGDEHNHMYSIAGAALLTSTSWSHRSTSDHFIRVRATDPGGLWFEKALEVRVSSAWQAPLLVGIERHEDALELRWTGENGHYYGIHAASNLASQFFVEASGIAALQSTNHYTHNLGENSRLFWRVANELPPEMRYIPDGSFAMGDPFSDGGTAERPVHDVDVSAVYCAGTEVSKGLWDQVYGWAITNGYSFDNVGSGKALDHPVHSVNWYDAVKWCNARSEKEGRIPSYFTSPYRSVETVYRIGQFEPPAEWVNWTGGYRLPTEAEWEKAGRGTLVGRRFPWGDTDCIQHSRANYYSSESVTYDTSDTRGFHPSYLAGDSPHTSPVGSFTANDFGLFDVAGNVDEWCWDYYSISYYRSSPPSDPRGPVDGSQRVVRGGGADASARNCRVARRDGKSPDSVDVTRGFRVVLPTSGIRCQR